MLLNRIDEPGTRQLSESSSPTFRSELIRMSTEGNKFFSAFQGGSSTPQANNERIYIPSRSFADEPPAARNTAIDFAVLPKEDGIGGTRRIVLTNGRRAFDQDVNEKVSG